MTPQEHARLTATDTSVLPANQYVKIGIVGHGSLPFGFIPDQIWLDGEPLPPPPADEPVIVGG